MSHALDYLLPAMWIGYFAYWSAMSKNVKEAARSESAASRLVRTVLMLCAIALLALPRVPLPFMSRRFLPLGVLYFWIGAAITAGGLLFSVWARRHLGKTGAKKSP